MSIEAIASTREDDAQMKSCKAYKLLPATVIAVVLSCPGFASAQEKCVLSVSPQKYGCFLDELDVRDIDGDRHFKLLSKFRYRDPKDGLWIVPKDIVVNGASIPRVLWVFGSPWVGKYRRASVVHDYFYRRPRYGSTQIHRVFYDAMLAGGVNRTKALVMYFVVLRFNPRWEIFPEPYDCSNVKAAKKNKIHCVPMEKKADGDFAGGAPTARKRIEVQFNKTELNRVKARIENGELSVVQVERIAERDFQAARRGQ